MNDDDRSLDSRWSMMHVQVKALFRSLFVKQFPGAGHCFLNEVWHINPLESFRFTFTENGNVNLYHMTKFSLYLSFTIYNAKTSS